MLAQTVHEASELQEIGYAEQRPLSAEHDLWIWSNNIRPLRRDRANSAVIRLEQELPAKTVVSVTHANELLPAEWMEGMRHTHKTPGCV